MNAQPPAPNPQIIELANAIATARKGAEFLRRVFELWEYWTGMKQCEDYRGEKVCPGCGCAEPDRVLAIHLEGCWFDEVRDYLLGFGIVPPMLYES